MLATSQAVAQGDAIEVGRHFAVGGVDEVMIDFDPAGAAIVGLPEFFESFESRLGIHSVAFAVRSNEILVGHGMRLSGHRILSLVT